MKFTLSTVLALLVASTSVSAACQRRRSTIPSTEVSIKEFKADEMVSIPNEKLVRRHKSGRRLRRDGPRAGPQGIAPDQPQKQSDRSSPSKSNSRSNGTGNSRSTPSMTSAAASEHTSSKAQSVRSSSSSSKAAAQTSKTSSAASSSSTSTGSSSSGSTYTGQATFYYQNSVAGACGSVSSDSDKVVALQTSMYNSGSHCGETITITNTDTGASTTAVVADECPSCSGSSSIDLSTGAFDAIGSEDTGVLNVSWAFN
ncbi:hypothetical protein JCM5353_008637 [Sporobolomyces roseus]